MERVSNEVAVSRPSAIKRNALRCPKCHALNPRDDLTKKLKFCDQCGHRLGKSHSKNRQARQHHRKEEPPPSSSSSSTEVIPVISTSSDGAWFWGPQELTQTIVTTQKLNHEIENRGDAPLDNQVQPHHLPTKRSLHKAHTAHAGPRDGRVDRLSSQQLRRVQSFGEGTASLLPPLAHAPPRAAIAPDHFKPNNAKSSTKKSAASTQIADVNANKPCALLWGHVLTDAIAEFESTSIILTAEIDSDERCISVLAQRLRLDETARSKYVVASTTSPLQFKLQELQKKVRINKEKLTMVHQRLQFLSEQRMREESGGNDEPEQCPEMKTEPNHEESPSNQETDESHGHAGTQRSSPRDENPPKKTKKKHKKHKKAKADTTTATTDPSFSTGTRPKSYDMEAAAIKIQQRFRVVRARRLFADMVQRAYQRVYDADTKRYFYYNPRTDQSQWEIPQALAKIQNHQNQNRRAPSARSLDSAAARIQSLYRRRAARVALRDMLQQVYEKVYDAESDSYYYYCKTTKSSSWEKPKLLRGADFPSPNTSATSTTSNTTVADTHDPQRTTAAAVTIQTLFRNRATRLFLKDLASGHIEKHFDTDAQAWYYFNKRTQQSF